MSVLIIPGWFPNMSFIDKIKQMYIEFGFKQITIFNYNVLSSISYHASKHKIPYEFRKQTNAEIYYDVIHVISGGFYIFSALRTFNHPFQGKYIIFDSTPILSKQIPASNAIHDATGIPLVITSTIGMLLEKYWESSSDYLRDVYEDIRTQNAICIIGEHDNISTERDIVDVFGLPVFVIPNAKHLTCFKTNPDLYRSIIFRFVKQEHSYM